MPPNDDPYRLARSAGGVRRLLSVDDLDDGEIDAITQPDGACVRPGARGGTLACLFEQPSTRTLASFAMAGTRLGLMPVCLPAAASGEGARDPHDELLHLSLAATCVVVRSARALDPSRLAGLAAPLVSAGDGGNEHPTQALVDVAAMRRRGLDGRTVVLMGDLRGHREHHSLARLLQRMGVRLRLLAPPGRGLPERYLATPVAQLETNDVAVADTVLADADFVYLTGGGCGSGCGRVARDHDREGDAALSMDAARAARVLRPGATVMHPFPRHGELAHDLDGSRWDGYREQAAIAVDVRRRVLATLLAD
ncbi:MAG: hypothetical protein RJA99_4447 [Pseudomonadota bacterium]|jgi:aspartate carbamoyltransferase catalytic subunit